MKVKRSIGFILVFAVSFILYNFIATKSVYASIYEGKWGKAQIFDCYRSSNGGGSIPQATYAFTAYNFANIYDSVNEVQFTDNSWGTGGDRYVKFIKEDGQLKLKLYDAYGNWVQDISNGGTVYGLDDIGFLYVTSDMYYGYFISNQVGYNYGDSVKYTPLTAIASDEDLNNYSASQIPLNTPTVIKLSTDSLGTAGDTKVIGLTSGHKYKVTVDGVAYYVTANGSLSTVESELAGLTGTEITGLTNGTTYDVQTYTTVGLADGSLGTARDTKVIDLTSGNMYKVISGETTYYVTIDGILSSVESDLGPLIMGDRITGLTSGIKYKVIAVDEETAYYVKADGTLSTLESEVGTLTGTEITGLAFFERYKVIAGEITKYVKTDGTLSTLESEVGALTGTEITGLINGTTYDVQTYTTTVVLADGSLGTARDTKVADLASGNMYKIIVDGVKNYVKADGTLSTLESEVGALTGTEITGLVNGTTYDVQVYTAVEPNEEQSEPTEALTGVAPTTDGGIDGKITGTTTAMEYKLSSDSTWTTVIGTEIDNLAAGTYDVRYAAKTGYNAGTQIQVTVPEDVADWSNQDKIVVRIKGNPGVGKTLTAEFIDENESEVTTGAAVTYEWYRLSSKYSESCTLVGEDQTYKVVGRDKGKYIKLVATYDGDEFQDITSNAVKSSSSSSSSSSSRSRSSASKAITGNGVSAPPTSKDTALGSMLQTTNNSKVVLTNSWGDKNLGGTVSNVVDKNGNYVGSMLTSSESGTAKLPIEYGDFKDLKYIYKYDSITNLFIKVPEVLSIDSKNIEVPVKKGETLYVTKSLFSDNILLKEGWNTINGVTYRVEGLDLKSGWVLENNTWYYMNETSKARVENNWNLVNNKWYAFNEKGDMETGWYYSGTSWYFLDTTNGDMKTGWKSVGGSWYYFNLNGSMASNKVIDGYTLGANGALLR